MTGDVLVLVLITFLVVNVILLVRAGAKGQLGRMGAAAGPSPQPPAAGGPPSPGPSRGGAPLEPAEPGSTLEGAAPEPASPGSTLEGAAPEPAGSDPTEVEPALARGGHDVLTGLDDQATWERRIADEHARARRYRRPVTVVRIELDGLERLTGLLGGEAGDRLIRAMADTLRRLARDTDHVAHLGHGSFGVLMPETPEEAAVVYVNRVGRACELWLESGAVAVRLAIGWAATSRDVDLAHAQRLASERMLRGQWRSTRRAGSLTGQDPGVATERPAVTASPLPVAPRRDWERCRDPNCDHKRDHRRDRSS